MLSKFYLIILGKNILFLGSFHRKSYIYTGIEKYWYRIYTLILVQNLRISTGIRSIVENWKSRRCPNFTLLFQVKTYYFQVVFTGGLSSSQYWYRIYTLVLVYVVSRKYPIYYQKYPIFTGKIVIFRQKITIFQKVIISLLKIGGLLLMLIEGT